MLKQLKLQLELKQKREVLSGLLSKQEAFKKRSTQLTEALEESLDEEGFAVIQQGIETLENETREADAENKIKTLNEEIQTAEQALGEIEARSVTTAQTARGKSKAEIGERGENMNKYQLRELFKTGEYYERAEVKEFYNGLKNLRAVLGSELLVPQIIVNRIMDIMGDYCTLYPLVDKIRANGTVRILVDTDTTAAEWMEMTGTIPSGDVGTITNVDFDGFKVGKVTFVDNSIIKDSVINLDDYVTKKIARSLALALDQAILKGGGSTKKQPEGILPNLPTENKVTVEDPKGYADIVRPISKIDTGADSVGEIVAVMKRQTYYDKILDYSVLHTAAGGTVGKLPNLGQPDLLGLRVVFNNCMEADQLLFGDFSKYTLIERESITIDSSEHVKFSEDQTGFRGKARFDGKPVNKAAFVLVTLTEAVPASE